MAGVTTIALIERRADISRELFTRYWRDVHGVMAARIPGFDFYVQHHVTQIAGDNGDIAFEGIAVVRFASEADRAGLAQSAVAAQIVRDEPNVFTRALLYNLEAQDSQHFNENTAEDRDVAGFLLFAEPGAAKHWASAASGLGMEVHLHDLRGADPSLWNGISPGAVGWQSVAQYWSGGCALPPLPDGVTVFRTDERYVMVAGGRPTPTGLRGADAVRTIREIGANNQLEHDVETLIFGV